MLALSVRKAAWHFDRLCIPRYRKSSNVIIPPSAMRNWKAILAGTALVCIGVCHSLWPYRITLDWPSVTLLIVGLLFCFSARVALFLPYLKRLRLGELDIELQEKLGDIREKLDEVEERRPGSNEQVWRTIGDTSIESLILELATKDKDAALLRLAIGIEQQMAELCKEAGLPLSFLWRESVEALRNAKIIEPKFAQALMEFRDVRNQVIHSGLRGRVKRSILTGTIDNGLQLLRLLKTSPAKTVR